MIIRDAIPGDIFSIQQIYEHHVLHGTGTFEEEPPPAEEMSRRYEAVLSNALPWLVADIDGGIGGYAYAQRYHSRSGWRMTLENSVYVAPGLSRKGIGKALLAALMQRCAVLGYAEVLAVIGDSKNAGSVGLHEAAGFTHAGLLKNVGLKFGRRLDVVIMQKSLQHG